MGSDDKGKGKDKKELTFFEKLIKDRMDHPEKWGQFRKYMGMSNEELGFEEKPSYTREYEDPIHSQEFGVIPTDARGGFFLMEDYIDILRGWGWKDEQRGFTNSYGRWVGIYYIYAPREEGEGDLNKFIIPIAQHTNRHLAWFPVVDDPKIRAQLDEEVNRRKKVDQKKKQT